MSTWQIFSDGDSDLQWKSADYQLTTGKRQRKNGKSVEIRDSDSRLPSMVDLLSQGRVSYLLFFILICFLDLIVCLFYRLLED